MRSTENLSDIEYLHLLTAARNAGRDWFNGHGPRPDGVLSGQWAGESMLEIGERYDLDLTDDELATAFEDGFDAQEAATEKERMGIS